MSIILDKRVRLSKSPGFTLIEALVVIAVISIIAAVIFPAMANARARAHQIVCLSNLRQLSFGVLQYSTDYDERCPLYFSGIPVTPGSRDPGYGGATQPPYLYWPELISPYIQSQHSHNFNEASKVFICPDAPYDSDEIAAYGFSNVSSYGLTDNWAEWYCPDSCNNGTGQSHSFTEAVEPASTVLLSETLNRKDITYPGFSLAVTPIDGGNSGYYYSSCAAPRFSAARMFDNISWRHSAAKTNWCDTPPSNARVNVAYSDGHAKNENLTTLSSFKRWAILQGAGDVGCRNDQDGQYGCWYP